MITQKTIPVIAPHITVSVLLLFSPPWQTTNRCGFYEFPQCSTSTPFSPSPPLSTAFSSYPYTLCLLLPFFGNVCLLTGSKQIVFASCIACRGLLQLINIISHSYEFRLLSKVRGAGAGEEAGTGQGQGVCACGRNNCAEFLGWA